MTTVPLAVPVVPFDQVQGRISRLWDPFELNPHFAVFGTTGSGKSHLIRHGILPMRAYSRTVVIDVKDDRDSVWTGFGTPVTGLPPAFCRTGEGPARAQYRLIVDRANAQTQLRRFFDQIRNEGHCVIVVDESREVTEREQIGLGSVVENLILTGRGIGITLIMGAQSTAWAVSALKDQPAALFIGQTRGTQQAKALSEIAGGGRELAATIGQIPARQWLYADGWDGPGMLALTTPLDQNRARGKGVMTNPPHDSLMPIRVYPSDTITARMPYPHERKTFNIESTPLLVVTHETGTQDIYDSTKHVAVFA
jgi:hypothetical protein